MRPGRTFELWLLILAFLILALGGFMRAQQAIAMWDTLVKIGLTPGPWYPVLSGALIALAGLAAALSLWWGARRAPRVARGAALLYAAWMWFDRLALTQSPAAQADTAFALGATLVCLAALFGILALRRQQVYFDRKER